MPATPEHKADVHRLVRERVDAGQPVWEWKIDLAGIFHNDSLPFEQWRDQIVETLRASTWVKRAEEFSDLREAVDELADTEDLAEFNQVWAAIYDLADYDRVWITTR